MKHNNKLRDIPNKRRTLPKTIKQLEEAQADLDKTFQLWPSANAEQLIRNTEDLKFLQSMKMDRTASFGPCDVALAQKIKRSGERSQKQFRRKEKHDQALKASTSHLSDSSETDTDASDIDMCPDTGDSTLPSSPISGGTLPCTSTPRSHHRSARTGTKAFIPHNILESPKLVSIATRMNITPTQQSALIAAVIVESGGDVSRVSTSYATADRSRRKVNKDIASTIKEKRTPPKLASLHWDSKLLPSLDNKNKNQERLPVAV